MTSPDIYEPREGFRMAVILPGGERRLRTRKGLVVADTHALLAVDGHDETPTVVNSREYRPALREKNDLFLMLNYIQIGDFEDVPLRHRLGLDVFASQMAAQSSKRVNMYTIEPARRGEALLPEAYGKASVRQYLLFSTSRSNQPRR